MALEDPFIGQYKDGFLQVNDLKLHYTEWNSGGSRPVLLVHGANVQLHTWDPIAADLARDYRVVAIDLRGHGDSDWTRDGYAIPSIVPDIKAMVDQLKLAPFDYVG